VKPKKLQVVHRLRVSAADAHYAGNLVDGARLMQGFGDVASELLIRLDGEEGLFRAYSRVEFLAPVFAGDFLEIVGEITRIGKSSRSMSFLARKVIAAEQDPRRAGRARVLKPPIVVCVAEGTCVVLGGKTWKTRS